MEKFFIVLGVIAVLLILLVILGGKNRWRKIVGFFVEEIGEETVSPSASSNSARKKKIAELFRQNGRRSNQTYTEMATLVQKVDSRRRVVDSMGHSTLSDEYFELVFQTRKGEILHLETSRASFKEVPFNQIGSLTHKRGKMVKFKYAGGLITDDISPMQ